MDKANFDYMLQEIYSAFNRAIPAENSPGYASLYRRVNTGDNIVPDAAAQYIATKLSEYDNLPMNLGKAIRNEYSNWRKEHPEQVRKRGMCPYCDPKAGPGFVFLHDDQGRNYLWRCTCNDDESASNFPPATLENIQRAGLKLGVCIDPSDPDGINPPKVDFLQPDMRQKIIASLGLGKTHRPRAEHMRAREAAGAYGYDAI